MLYVALAEAAALAVVVIAFAGLLRSQMRAHARREDQLVNQLCHLAGRPWAPAPAYEPEPIVGDLPEVLLVSPEQMGEDW